MYKISDISKETVAKVNSLEEELGVQIMAIEEGPAYAELSDEQISKVRALEEETGKVLLVYQS